MDTQKITNDLSDEQLIEVLEKLWEEAEDGMMQRDIGTAITIVRDHDLISYHIYGEQHFAYGKAKMISLRYNWKHPSNFSANENNVKKNLVIQKTG